MPNVSNALPSPGTAWTPLAASSKISSFRARSIRWYVKCSVMGPPRKHADVNAVVAGYLRDLAFAQPTQPQMFGDKRAAAAILALETPLTDLIGDEGRLPKIAGVGPGSARVIQEVLETGGSPTVERAIDLRERRDDIERRRALRRHFLSRAEVLRIIRDPTFGGPRLDEYRGDLQMHSEWSDGYPTLDDICKACQARGYSYAAVTDHSHGLKIAGGMSMTEAVDQRRAIDRINAAIGDRFRLLRGIEADIGADGALDLSPDEAVLFDIVLTPWHAKPLRPVVCLLSIATLTRRNSWHTRKSRWLMRGSPAFRPNESSTAGHWIVCSPGFGSVSRAPMVVTHRFGRRDDFRRSPVVTSHIASDRCPPDLWCAASPNEQPSPCERKAGPHAPRFFRRYGTRHHRKCSSLPEV
jgi:hypothetical protein